MSAKKEKEQWLRSSDARKVIKASTCDLAHMRNDGAISYKKEGNAYLYKMSDLLKKKSTA